MDNMTAAEMCEVLNPMLALNKLTVYSNARRGVGHVVTDNVIAADTTKYRNPLDKILPEYDYETLLAQTTSDGATEPQELEKYSEQKVADTSERACVINQKPDTSGNFANENSNIPPTSKQQHILEGKEASGCNAKKSDVPRNATDTDPPKNEPEALEEPYKDTGRYSRGPKQAAESSLKGGPPIVTLVRESSAFGGVLCCGKNTKMVPVTRITSPSTVEEARLSRRKRTTGANVRPNVSAGQQRQADCQDHLYLLDVSTDLTSSTSHETLTSETNASSVVLLPVLPAIPLSGNKTRECKPSPPLLRRGDSRSPCVRDISRTYSPTQAI
ncbi:hypothetical protein RRG08_007046 [Elysia crispata]|uniref:Uncharacterized protein n=1 Tax=Elysia crispata TaxID=231223 RepID=A0AAE0ZIX5_9GAST|nr:hypothetical protein RRG08_007046 [Elysia crispata]